MNKKYVIGLKLTGQEDFPCVAFFTYIDDEKQTHWEYSKTDPKIKIFDDLKSAMKIKDKIYNGLDDLKGRGTVHIDFQDTHEEDFTGK